MPSSISQRREDLIISYNESQNKKLFEINNGSNFFALGLNMYSKNYSFESVLYNSFAKSEYDSEISLHRDQLRFINEIESNKGIIFSAPTSFGKTFCIFEYIVRKRPKNVVLVVPTLALAAEYINNFLSSEKLKDYKMHIDFDDNCIYDFNNFNVFILTHEKVVGRDNFEKIEQIDFLVIDEVYKLSPSITDNDRVLILNLAYRILVNKAKKYVLLAPFISGLEEKDEELKFLSSTFSPIVQKINPIFLDQSNLVNIFSETTKLLNNECKNKKTIIYFTRPDYINKFLTDQISSFGKIDKCTEIRNFINWAKSEIHPDWVVLKGLDKGFVVHHGQLTPGIRNFLLYIFNTKSSFNRLLCTSTLLEGVNTSSECLIVTKAGTGSLKNFLPFKAFDFFNLAGRTGRLNKYLIGYTYYFSSNNEIPYKKEDAAVSIKFESINEDNDLTLHLGSKTAEETMNKKLEKINFTVEDFKAMVGTAMKVDSFIDFYNDYLNRKNEFITALKDKKYTSFLYNFLCMFGSNVRFYKIILSILHQENPTIKTILSDLNDSDIDARINDIMFVKNSFLEHSYLSKIKILKCLLKKDLVDEALLNDLQDNLITKFDILYYVDSPEKRILKNLGIYDSDIDKLIEIIGNNFSDVNDVADRIKAHKDLCISSVSFISRFSIKRLIGSN